MLTVNIHDAKTQLSKLVDQAAQGEAFIIAKAGKPMVKVVPLGKAEAGTESRGARGATDRNQRFVRSREAGSRSHDAGGVTD